MAAAPTLMMVLLYGLSIVGFALALEKMDVGVAYAVRPALGIALVATVGTLWFDEPATGLKLVSIGIIIVGVVFLNLN